MGAYNLGNGVIKEVKKRPQVFLCYAREDRRAVEAVYESLYHEGVRPWMDVRNIFAGETWGTQIRESLNNSDFVLVFLSTHSVGRRGFLQREIKSALELFDTKAVDDPYLIPVRLEDCEVPRALQTFQYVDLFREGGWEALLSAVKSGTQHGGEVSQLKESIEKEKPKSHLFIAMPFSKEMEDRYYYGIQRAADTNGFACKRVDKDSFTGDVLQQVITGIETSSAVVADLTSANPNVYLEVGLAWGKKIPAILLIEENQELCFDVRGQRCLVYNNIRKLEEVLSKELEDLKSKGLL